LKARKKVSRKKIHIKTGYSVKMSWFDLI